MKNKKRLAIFNLEVFRPTEGRRVEKAEFGLPRRLVSRRISAASDVGGKHQRQREILQELPPQNKKTLHMQSIPQ
jgi:hypothetical protein